MVKKSIAAMAFRKGAAYCGNNRIYYEKRLPDEDVAKLYVRTGLPERLLVDPAACRKAGGTLESKTKMREDHRHGRWRGQS
jgi:predicted Zn-ribbon and HTH transcriptional regulator